MKGDQLLKEDQLFAEVISVILADPDVEDGATGATGAAGAAGTPGEAGEDVGIIDLIMYYVILVYVRHDHRSNIK